MVTRDELVVAVAERYARAGACMTMWRVKH